MHTLIGFIQLLLILTHSRLVPKELLIWNEQKAVVAKTTGGEGQRLIWETPAEKENLRTEALVQDDRDIWLTQPSKVYQVYNRADGSKLLPPQAVVWGIKRYLVFCQLKTEG
jgi:hypothetical protein